jgi:hypothetical protein
MPGGKLVRKPLLIHNLFHRGCPLWAVEKIRSQKHPRHTRIVIDEDGWPGTRVSVIQNVANQAGDLPQSQAMSALCSPSSGRRQTSRSLNHFVTTYSFTELLTQTVLLLTCPLKVLSQDADYSGWDFSSSSAVPLGKFRYLKLFLPHLFQFVTQNRPIIWHDIAESLRMFLIA